MSGRTSSVLRSRTAAWTLALEVDLRMYDGILRADTLDCWAQMGVPGWCGPWRWQMHYISTAVDKPVATFVGMGG